MQLLPALVEDDLDGFGSALTDGAAGHGCVVCRRSRAASSHPGQTATLVAKHGRVGRGGRGTELLGTRGLWAGGRETAAPETGGEGRGARWVREGQFSRGAFTNTGARVWQAEPAAVLIDSSFFRMYTGPSKPTVRRRLGWFVKRVQCVRILALPDHGEVSGRVSEVFSGGFVESPPPQLQFIY